MSWRLAFFSGVGCGWFVSLAMISHVTGVEGKMEMAREDASINKQVIQSAQAKLASIAGNSGIGWMRDAKATTHDGRMYVVCGAYGVSGPSGRPRPMAFEVDAKTMVAVQLAQKDLALECAEKVGDK